MLYPAELRGRPRRAEDSFLPGKCEEAPKRHRCPAIFAAIVLTCAAPAAAETAACPLTGADTAPNTVMVAAAAAETLRLADGSLVRLAGIDAPEWASSGSTAALDQLLPQGATVTLAPTAAGKPDRYSRRHAFVFLADGRLLQAALVGEGAARARWLPGESACLSALIAAEHEARREKLGLWASPEAILAADDPSLVRRTGLYEVIGGRLASVGHGSAMTFLDFGQDHRRDFTVMASAAVTKALTQTLGSVDSLVGRHLLVRGVIQKSHGAAIRLNDAAEIELSEDPPKPLRVHD